MIRKLGRKWKPLHSLVYTISVLALLHYVWLVKADLREPLIYAASVATLLGVRLAASRRLRQVRPQIATPDA